MAPGPVYHKAKTAYKTFKKNVCPLTVLWHIRHKDPTSARVAMKFGNLPTNEAFEETHLHRTAVDNVDSEDSQVIQT